MLGVVGSDLGGLLATAALALIIALTAAILRLAPGLSRMVLDDRSSKRVQTIDGLRGILALSVLLHHTVVSFVTAHGWAWTDHSTNLESELGSCAVALFFMISAYLFCGKLIRDRGRLDSGAMLQGRIMRIVPLFVLCLALVAVYTAVDSGFQLREPAAKVGREFLRVASFGFLPRYELNGSARTVDLLSQSWTLKYEWILYGLLPILALGYRRSGRWLAIYAGLIAGCFFWPIFALFVAGTAASQLAAFDGPRARIAWQAAGAIGLAAAILLLRFSDDWRAAVLLTPFFVAVIQAGAGYRLLAARPLRFLGEISYSLYLLHSFVLWTIYRLLGDARVSALSSLQLGGVMLLTGLLAIAIATASFCLIERPLMGMRPFTTRRRDTAVA